MNFSIGGLIAGAAMSVLVAGCGSSGDSGKTNRPHTTSSKNSVSSVPVTPSSQAAINRWQLGVYGAPDDLYARCAKPRTGVDPATGYHYPDQQGSLLHEQLFIRSAIHDTYLWYSEVVDRNPAGYASAAAYFDVLKTQAITASGRAKDSYHFSMTTAEANQQSSGSAVASHGLSYAILGFDTQGLNIQVRHLVAGSPADTAGIMRGDRVMEVNQLVISEIETDAQITYLSNALFAPVSGQTTTMVFERSDGSLYTRDLIGADVVPAVLDSRQIISHGDKTLGYFMLHNFSAPAEAALRDLFTDFAKAGVNELVLDLRYNGGGYIPIAAQLGYMIAGPRLTQNKIFAKTIFNDKHPLRDPFTGEPLDEYDFLATTSGYFGNGISALPTLNLSQVTVITTEESCSASELVINGLRGAGIKVTQIGSTTCGKPYGFYEVANCGMSYFYVQMQTVNHVNFGSYADGFSPSARDDGKTQVAGCRVDDDLTYPLGDVREKNFAEALRLLDGESCSRAILDGYTALADAALESPVAAAQLTRLRADQQSPLDQALLVKPLSQ